MALSGYKIVFPSTEGQIIFIDNREIKWQFKLDSNYVAAAGLCADKQQNIYILDNSGKLYSLTVKGQLRWKHYFNKISDSDIVTFSDLLAVDDGIISASTDGKIAKYDFDGKIKWAKKFNTAIMKYFPSDNKGNIYIPLTNNIYGQTDTLLALNKNGMVNWITYFEKIRIIKPPVFHDSKIYLCCVKVVNQEKYPLIICLDDKGKVKWKKEISQTARFISIDSEGIVYIVAYDAGLGKPISMILSYNQYGKLLWRKFIEVTVISPIMISENLLVFVGTDEEASGVYFMRKNGFLENIISLSEAPVMYLQPLVTPNNNIIFGGFEKVQLIRIDETPFKKFIPW